MADTALKFGPEWMRALCDRGPAQAAPNSPTPASIPVVKYKLAEYRYGREEMLALFDQNTRPPDELKRDNPQLFKDECQTPLALIPMTEEESGLWAQSVNSDVVLRLTNKDRQQGPSTRALPTSDRGPDPRREIRSSRGGPPPPPSRGGPIGRGAPGMPGPSGRSFGYRSFEDDVEGDRKDGFRSDFKRGVSLNDDFRDRDRDRGFRDSEDSSKPRVRLDSRSNVDNWRKKPPSEADRVSSWRGGSSRDNDNWKERSSWRDDRNDDDPRNGRRGYREWDHHSEDNALPEWSLDDGGTTVGSFDASGAFRSGSPDVALEDEDDGEGEWHSVKSGRSKRNSERESQREQAEKHHDRRDFREDSHTNNERGRSSPDERHGRYSQPDDHRNDRSGQPPDEKNSCLESRNRPAVDNERNNVQNDQAFLQFNSTSETGDTEEEHFFSIEKLTEHMVMKWTEEEEAKISMKESQTNQHQSLPRSNQLFDESHVNDMNASSDINSSGIRWFYRDPQGDIQGPFMAQEMLEWFNAGYFQMDLLVRRSIDETFSQLGQLIKLWGRIPFAPGVEMPPLKASNVPPKPQNMASASLPQPLQSTLSPSHATDQMRQLFLLQQRQRVQQQQLLQQQQLRQLLEHLRCQKGFCELSQQQQQQILIKQYTEHIDNKRRLQQQQELTQMHGRPVNTIPPGSGGLFPAPSGPSIWELSNGGVLTSAALEEMQRREEQELHRKEMEERRRHEVELAENAARKAAEDERQRMLELQSKLEEERRIKEERAKKEEEHRRLREEEERRLEEERRRKLAEEEQRRRHEEMRRLEDMARKMKEENERRMREEDEKHRLQQLQKQELERQARLKEHDARLRLQQQQSQQRAAERKGWGEVSTTPTAQLSLAEIQRLQEEKERDERLKQAAFQKQQMQTLFQQQSMSQKSSGLSGWVQSGSGQTSVKTLSEIQREEAEKLARLKKEQEEREKERQPPANAGIWSNAASHLSWKNSPGQSGPAWGTKSTTPQPSSSSTANVGFWETDPPITSTTSASRNSSSSTRSSAIPPAPNQKPLSAGVNQSKPSAKSKKEEESAKRLFDNRTNDEFTSWCEEALSKFKGSLDVPTFVAFLKELESPFDVNDYIKSYLGETRDAREFAKHFLEKRSYYRNQERKQEQEHMWGPAPAITPSVNKTSNNGNSPSTTSSVPPPREEDSQAKGAKGKKKKGKRLVDTSLLGFTVQADPDRIEHGED